MPVLHQTESAEKGAGLPEEGIAEKRKVLTLYVDKSKRLFSFERQTKVKKTVVYIVYVFR